MIAIFHDPPLPPICQTPFAESGKAQDSFWLLGAIPKKTHQRPIMVQKNPKCRRAMTRPRGGLFGPEYGRRYPRAVVATYRKGKPSRVWRGHPMPVHFRPHRWWGLTSANHWAVLQRYEEKTDKLVARRTAIEYGLIAAGISIAIIAAVNGLGTNLNSKFTSINTSLK
jgi:pilus assembly protein Flp/PilA